MPIEITAALLSMGEPFAERARESVARQTLAPVATVEVRDVSPFHVAFNQAVDDTRTTFFAQVDADMILDPTCFERLAACIEDDVGAVIGHLRDPLVGRVAGIKLFRAACFERDCYENAVSPDTDHLQRMGRLGWNTIYALNYEGHEPALWHSFGDHRPDYSAPYVFAKCSLEGSRYLHRRNTDGLRWFLRQLAQSGHPQAVVAMTAFADGVFAGTRHDALAPYGEDRRLRPLQNFLAADAPRPGRFPARFPIGLASSPRRILRRWVRRGEALRRAGAGRDYAQDVTALAASRHPWGWLAMLGLARGVLGAEAYGAAGESDLSRLAPLTDPHRPLRLGRPLRRRWLARARHLWGAR